MNVSLGPPTANVRESPTCPAWNRARALGLTARSTRARRAGCIRGVTRKVAMSDRLPVRGRVRAVRLEDGRRGRGPPAHAPVDQLVELDARDPEPLRGVRGQRGRRHAGHELVGGFLRGVELHLEEAEPPDGLLTREAG